jgi:hypothetical protein
MNSTRLSLLSSGENSQRGKALFMVSIQNYDLILSNIFYTKSMFNQIKQVMAIICILSISSKESGMPCPNYFCT